MSAAAIVIDATDSDSWIAAVREAAGESVIVRIAAGLDPLAAAMVRGGIGPLAIERAPAIRVNAVAGHADADDADIAAAITWLTQARSVTGQVIVISARG